MNEAAYKEKADAAQYILDHQPKSVHLILYQALYARGIRIQNIDFAIEKAVKEETQR